MTPSQKLRSIADSTGLDGIADAIREIANEIERNNAPAVPQGEQATIAGLDAANGHLSTLLDDSVLMLKQLRQMVDDLHERWSNGGKPERGEFELLDCVDDWLSCRPDSIVTAHAPAQEVGLTDEAVNDAAKVLAERFDCPWEHMPEEGRKNMRTQARAVVIAALRAKGASDA